MLLNNDFSSYAHASVSFGDGVLDSVLGIAVVFFGLICLMYVIKLMGAIMTRKKPAAAPAAPAAPVKAEPVKLAPGSAGECKLYDTPDRDAAMIMAIVADEMGVPLNELRFISIREVK